MRIKEGFILKPVADSFIIVPVANEFVDLGAMITVNETGAFLWELLSEEVTKETLVSKLKEEYDAPKDVIESDVEAFLENLRKNGMLIE